MPRFLAAKCPMITILLCKSHFVFCASHEYNFLSHHTFSRCTVTNVFCFFDYPKLYFCRERAITRSCSHSLLNTWFALHSLMYDGIILFGGGAVPTLFQIMHAPQISSLNSRKKYVWNIHVYTVHIDLILQLYNTGTSPNWKNIWGPKHVQFEQVSLYVKIYKIN